MSVAVELKWLPHGEGLPLPRQHSVGAAGLDLAAAILEGETVDLLPGQRGLVPCGFALALPTGYEGQVRPRSSLAMRHGVTVLNAPGTIDADYRGEVKVILINHGDEPLTIRRGDRIAQLVVAPVAEVTVNVVEALDATVRGEGGFGSTGR